MNSFQDLLINRRSIRQFTDQDIPAEDVKTILEAALLSPTGKNSRAWHFIAVDSKEMLEKMSQCKGYGASSVARAKMAVVVCVDVTSTETWIEDGSIAAFAMMLQAKELGLGSCWIEINGRFAEDGTPAEDMVSELLGLPEQIMPLCFVTLGYPAEERKPQNLEKLLWERVHIGSFHPEQCLGE